MIPREYINAIIYNREEQSTPRDAVDAAAYAQFFIKKYREMKEKQNMTNTQAAIEYEKKKQALLKEKEARLFQLEQEHAASKDTICFEYKQKLYELDKEWKDAEITEQINQHAAKLKEAYDAYIKQGFTKAQAESFLALFLKPNQEVERDVIWECL